MVIQNERMCYNRRKIMGWCCAGDVIDVVYKCQWTAHFVNTINVLA